MFVNQKTKLWIIVVISMLGVLRSAQAFSKGREEIGLQAGGVIIEGDSKLKKSAEIGARVGYFITDRTSLEGSVMGGETKIKSTDKDLNFLIPTLEAQYHLGEGRLHPFIAAGAGVISFSPSRYLGRHGTNFLALYGAGLKYSLTRSWLVRLDARHAIDTESGRGTHIGILMVGLSYLVGNEAPATPKVVAAPNVVDSDADGIPDAQDACPGTPAGVAVDAKGCPKDSDGDGVADFQDTCPGTPAGIKVDTHGCPVDSDGDGVTDDKDKCPGTPAGIKVDADGCPAEATKALPKQEWVLTGVEFAVNSEKIDLNSTLSLERAVDILTANPTVRVEVQGHSDNTGSAAYNLKLSDKRAVSVKEFLVKKGISADRLETKGYGMTSPIADNGSKEGRSKNRRIEFKILSR